MGNKFFKKVIARMAYRVIHLCLVRNCDVIKCKQNRMEEKTVKSFKKITIILVAVLILLTITACGNTGQGATNDAQPAATASTAGSGDKEYKFAYICSMLTSPWFIQEEWGIQQKVNELNLDYFCIDANFVDERCMEAVEQVINTECDAVIIAVTNTSLGPAIAEKFKKAGVAFVTIDDPILDGDGVMQKHVGLESYDCGLQGGRFIGKKANEKNFINGSNNVKVMCLDMPSWPDVHRRTIGYMDGIKELCPQLTDADFIMVDVKDGAFESSLAPAAATFNANPDVSHWLVIGLNDDCVTAAMKVFEESAFDFTKVFFNSIGGNDMALDVYKRGGTQAESYTCVAIPADEEGQVAVQVLYDFLKHGKEIPDTTFVGGVDVDYANYLDYFVDGKLPQDR